MPKPRIIRVNEVIKREIAEQVYRMINDAGFDFSAMTIARVETSPDLRHANVYVSIRQDHPKRALMFQQLLRHRKQFQQQINKHVTLKYIPRLRFVLDNSVVEGNEVLHIIEQLERKAARESPPLDPDEEE